MTENCWSSGLKRWSVLGMAVFTFGLLSTSHVSAYVARKSATIGSGLSPSAQQLVSKAIDAQTRAADKAEGRPANSLAVDCMFAAELVRQGDKRFTPYLQARVDALLKLASQTESGGPTWSRRKEDNDLKRCPAGGIDAFGDGTCDPPGTPYAFQSGLALTCLGRAAEVLGRQDLQKLGNGSLPYWAKRASSPAACGNCLYFWSSGNADDRNRYVRNTNIYLSLGAAAVAQNDKDWSLVKRSVAAESFEQRMGNQGYLGALDPQWAIKPGEKTRTEDHMAGMAAALLSIHNLRNDPEALQLARWNYKTWANCSDSLCSLNKCSYWSGDPKQCKASATFVHCTFRQIDPNAKALCEIALSKSEKLNTGELLFILAGD
ncbi:hypothetical protein [Microvirga sp. 2TAF3]|uniref:hypothetical protein n=1 Tax=Microvirga sp. 2TAF3 TaxID=3233014 RepID=UPI003F95D3A7